MKRKLIFFAVVAVGAGPIPGAYAADVSTERTRMPDYCSERDVTCVLPDSAGASGGIPAPRGTVGNSGSISGPTTSTTPSIPGASDTSTSTESKVVVTPVSSTGGTAGIQTRGSGSATPGNATTSGRATIGTSSGAATGSGPGATGASGGGAAGAGAGGSGARR